MHPASLYIGLTNSSQTQLAVCREIIEKILQRIKDERPYHDQVFSFWSSVILSLENEFMSRISYHFISSYLCLLPPNLLSDNQKRLINNSALEYYGFLLTAIDSCNFDEFIVKFRCHYHNYYQYGGVVFSTLEDETIFKEQALYERLLEDLCIKIVSGELKKGDKLPTTKRLCAEYNISTTTVNRAYGILVEMGFINRRVRSGTTLIAKPDDPGIKERLKKVAGLHQRDWKDAVQVLIIINNALGRYIVITPRVIQQMSDELARQFSLYKAYNAPFFVSGVLLDPLLDSIPTGVLHEYYIQSTDALNRVITLCTFHLHRSKAHGEEIYAAMCDALGALKRGDQKEFTALSERALLKKISLLTEEYADIAGDIANIDMFSNS